jgi:hypothetical protein
LKQESNLAREQIAVFRARSAFSRAQIRLSHFNRARLAPGLGADSALYREEQRSCEADEEAFIAEARKTIAPFLQNVPDDANGFLAWFEALKASGPGQGDPIFPWLAEHAGHAQMRWFLSQELAGEAGFDDLVALAQVKMPVCAKLEMARNYWDEMGRGEQKGMHGPLLGLLADYFEIDVLPEEVVPEALALGNMMVGLAVNRRYAFHAVGALGAIELTAPTRAGYVAEGLKRLDVPAKERNYFALHATLDLRHAEKWNKEVIHSLVAEDSRRAAAIGEGALLRLWCGARCFERYRMQFGL